MDDNIVNFGAGPAMLPREVLLDVQEDFLSWHQGMSVLEISHRSEPVLELKHDIEQDLRELLLIPDDYIILIMHGGARAQFSAVPLNLLEPGQSATYLLTGTWGKKAAECAQSYRQIHRLQPDCTIWDGTFDVGTFEHCEYVHVTDNETIEGIELPDKMVIDVPVISDMTSNILSRPVDWSQIKCAYASAQKNLGISGATFVILQKDLLNKVESVVPDILSYKLSYDYDSMYNTPSVYSWYVAEKILKWVKKQGGVQSMQQLAEKRSQLLYQFIDQSAIFNNDIPDLLRSRMNVPFQIKTNEPLFFQEAQAQGLHFLEGHRSVGGARASMYNAMPLEGLSRLIDFMRDFELRMA